MRRFIQDWQIKGSFTQKHWTLEVKEKNAWSVEAEGAEFNDVRSGRSRQVV